MHSNSIVIVVQATLKVTTNNCKFDCLVRRPVAMGFTAEQCKAFEACYNKLVQIADDDQKLVQHVDTMVELMIKGGEATVKHIHCKSVVPHPKNRNSTLMSHRKVFIKGGKILGVGFSVGRCSPKQAIAFQRNPACFVPLRQTCKWEPSLCNI